MHRPSAIVSLPYESREMISLASVKDRSAGPLVAWVAVVVLGILYLDAHATQPGDGGGVEARRFRVATSGHVLLYDVRGLLIFSGGITAARGHRGDSYGRAAVHDRILNPEGTRSGSPVFGCPLAAPRSTVSQESR
jgi:hypothetical protein